MSAPATFEHFERELNRLVEQFGKHLAVYKGGTYDEANVRKDFLDPFFRALGWDMDNRAGLIPNEREVEIESRIVGLTSQFHDVWTESQGHSAATDFSAGLAGLLERFHLLNRKNRQHIVTPFRLFSRFRLFTKVY